MQYTSNCAHRSYKQHECCVHVIPEKRNCPKCKPNFFQLFSTSCWPWDSAPCSWSWSAGGCKSANKNWNSSSRLFTWKQQQKMFTAKILNGLFFLSFQIVSWPCDQWCYFLFYLHMQQIDSSVTDKVYTMKRIRDICYTFLIRNAKLSAANLLMWSLLFFNSFEKYLFNRIQGKPRIKITTTKFSEDFWAIHNYGIKT